MKNIILAISFLSLYQTASAEITGDYGKYIFRYKSNASIQNSDTDLETKSISAFYTAGVGINFSEILPLKPEWQDDDWRIVSGSIPDGITFNPQTRMFSGTPSKTTQSQIAHLEGYDTNGNFVARAIVNFDVVTIEGIPVETTLYAHKGKFKVDELPIPSELPNDTAISSWTQFYDLPQGINLSSRYVQGTPLATGVNRLLVQGKNYKGDVVATYFGKYVVEDGPTFPHIPDILSRLPQLELGYGLTMDFGAPNPYGINYQIDPARKVRYALEKKEIDKPFPGTMASNGNPTDLRIGGWISRPYDTSIIRFKATDVDGTVGYSNWFEFGSTDPQPSCNPYSSQILPFVTGKFTNTQIPTPYGAQGALNYRLVSGDLPDGLSLDSATGIINGIPTRAGDTNDVQIVIDVSNGENLVSTSACKYTAIVYPGDVLYSDLISPQDRHIRLGDRYNGRFAVIGGIPNYSLSFSDPSEFPYLTLLNDTTNASTVEFSGISEDAGLKSVGFKLNNGDGSQYTGYVDFTVHGPLSVGPVNDLHVKRLEKSQTWAQIPYDEDSVIPDVSDGNAPRFTYTGLSDLPAGLSLDQLGYLTGETSAKVGTYGPFTATITDASATSQTSNTFNIIVDDRAPISLTLNETPSFSVEWASTQTKKPFNILEPQGAIALNKLWSISAAGDNTVPEWLKINTETGDLSVLPNTPHNLVGENGPFVVTVQDADGAQASLQFFVTLQDWPLPHAENTEAKGSVSGKLLGETTTSIPMSDLRLLFDNDTIIGGANALTFTSSIPPSPAGLTFENSTGRFVGQATEPFSGTVEVYFKDKANREGKVQLNLEVRAYPSIAALPNYSLPRNALAQNLDTPLKAELVDGFWTEPTWSVDTVNGTDINSYGLSIDPTTGVIHGSTSAPEGTVISNVVLMATSRGANGEILRSHTSPLSVTVTNPLPLEVSYTPTTATFYLDEGSLIYRGKNVALPKVKGSFKAPLTWSIAPSSEIALSQAGLSFDKNSGEVIGVPTRLGKWNLNVSVTDSEGRTNANEANLSVLSTLSGDIQHESEASLHRVLRVNQLFSTPSVNASNYMPPIIYSIEANQSSGDLIFDEINGSFKAGSKFVNPGTYLIISQATDNDGRTFGENPIEYSFDVVGSLAASVYYTSENINARQYSNEDGGIIDVSFDPTITNKIGDIRYTIDGDLPGILVYKDKSTYTLASTGAALSILDLPRDALVFDVNTAKLKGIPSKVGTYSLRLVAHDSHLLDYQDYNDPSRISSNTAYSQNITLTVSPNIPLELVSTENPKGVIAPDGNGNMDVAAVFNAYGIPPTYSIAGENNLPPGITYLIDGDGVHFSGQYAGTIQQLGDYTGVTVGAVDALGRTATLPITFHVLLSTDPIELDVHNVKTKIGMPIEMTSVAGNYFGALRYYSNDLSGVLGNELNINQSTGRITGSLHSTGEYVVDVYVTDATNRVTSKPIMIEVLPNMTVAVPEEVLATQGNKLNRTILTDHAIGEVSYKKTDPSKWPDGYDVDPQTGTITNQNITTNVGTYADLQITAVDSFETGDGIKTDTQLSNVFSIVVSPIQASPIIQELPKTILGTTGTLIHPLIPTVVDDVNNKPWNYDGTEYTTNYDLSQYGLEFDHSTGRIYGTPTSAFVIEDFTITVTSYDGSSDTTKPFWIGVAPTGNMSITTSPLTSAGYIFAKKNLDTKFNINVNNAFGTLTFNLPSGLGIDSQENENDNTITAVGVANISQTGVTGKVISVVDAFGRTASTTVNFGVFDGANPACIPPIESSSPDARNVWTVVFGGNVEGTNGYNGNNNVIISDITFYDANGNCYTPMLTSTYYRSPANSNMYDGNPNTNEVDGLGSSLSFNYTVPVEMTYATITMVGNTQNDLRKAYICKGPSQAWGPSGIHEQCSQNVVTFTGIGETYSPGTQKILLVGETWGSVTQSNNKLYE